MASPARSVLLLSAVLGRSALVYRLSYSRHVNTIAGCIDCPPNQHQSHTHIYVYTAAKCKSVQSSSPSKIEHTLSLEISLPRRGT